MDAARAFLSGGERLLLPGMHPNLVTVCGAAVMVHSNVLNPPGWGSGRVWAHAVLQRLLIGALSAYGPGVSFTPIEVGPARVIAVYGPEEACDEIGRLRRWYDQGFWVCFSAVGGQFPGSLAYLRGIPYCVIGPQDGILGVSLAPAEGVMPQDSEAARVWWETILRKYLEWAGGACKGCPSTFSTPNAETPSCMAGARTPSLPAKRPRR